MKTEDAFDSKLAVCEQIFQHKLKQYGVSWSELRLRSLADRIFAKASRIRRLESLGGKGQINESAAEEFIGIINYSVMFLDRIRHYSECEAEDRSALLARWSDAGLAAKNYGKIIDDSRELLLRKDHDYFSAWRSMAPETFTDEILTRVLRIRTLLSSDVVDKDALEGQLLDMLNYAAFALILEGEVDNGRSEV